MKDKLVKTHHKGAFFYFKKIGFCFSIFMGATICVAIPLSVATIIKNNEKNKRFYFIRVAGFNFYTNDSYFFRI